MNKVVHEVVVVIVLTSIYGRVSAYFPFKVRTSLIGTKSSYIRAQVRFKRVTHALVPGVQLNMADAVDETSRRSAALTPEENDEVEEAFQAVSISLF